MSAHWLISLALVLASCGPHPLGSSHGDGGGNGNGDGGACDGGDGCASVCGLGIDTPAFESAQHIVEPTPIVYHANPPASGNHWPMWQEPWGDYPTELPRERWVHNLEHGGVVLLYNCPAGCEDLHQQLVALRNGLAPDKFNLVRVLITPDTQMPHKLAAVAWGWRWQGEAIDLPTVKCFIAARYDRGTESVP